jgi:hypothetical protein
MRTVGIVEYNNPNGEVNFITGTEKDRCDKENANVYFVRNNRDIGNNKDVGEILL